MGRVIICVAQTKMSRQVQLYSRSSRPVILNPWSRYCPAAALPDYRYGDYNNNAHLGTVNRGVGGGAATPDYRYNNYNNNAHLGNVNRGVGGGAARRDPPCNICSNGWDNQVFHYHFSSEYQRMQALADRRSYYFCEMCGTSHVTDTPVRRNVIFTSSTLINFWKDSNWFPSTHVDCEVVVGGKVEDGLNCFKIMYSNNPTPLNVVLALGINNVLKGDSMEKIVEDLHVFQSTVINHSISYKHAILGIEKNTFSICPLIMPPTCVNFNRSYHATPADKTNVIKNLNDRVGYRVPAYLNLLSTCTDNVTGTTSHRYNQWREDEVGGKLHLTSTLKSQAANKIMDYSTYPRF